MGEAEQLHSRLVICGPGNAQDYDVAILPTLCRLTFHIYPLQINFTSSVPIIAIINILALRYKKSC